LDITHQIKQEEALNARAYNTPNSLKEGLDFKDHSHDVQEQFSK
jgi:hypothetical protein